MSQQANGFEWLPSDPIQVTLLLCFDRYGELVQPTLAVKKLWQEPEARKAVRHLVRQQLVTLGRPLRLTQKGKRVVKDLRNKRGCESFD